MSFKYCLPIGIAYYRQHADFWQILVITLAFGWTVVGWIIALLWACNMLPGEP